MKKISKKIFCKDSGRCFGYVLDICIDFEKLAIMGYYVVEEESENEYFLSDEKILSVSGFLVVQNETDFEFVSDRKSSLMGKVVLSSRGDDFGKVVDLRVLGKRLVSVFTDKAEICAKYIKFVGDDAIFVFEKRKSQMRRVRNKNNNEILVSVLQNTERIFPVPEKVSLSSDFYVGKFCHRDILGYNNERLISKGEIVDLKVFEKAKLHNKLNELYFAIENKKNSEKF